MRRQLLLFAAGLAVVAGALAYLGPLRYLRTDDAERAREARINSSTRVLAYPVDTTRSLALTLRPDDTELRLVTNLVIPVEALPGEAQAHTTVPGGAHHDFAYGLVCRFLDPSGRVLWEGEYWEKTRKTLIVDPGQVLPLEEVFLDDAANAACDSRVTHLMLRHLIATGARRLEVSLVDARGAAQTSLSARVLVRALRVTELTEREALRRWSRMSDDARDGMLRQLSVYGADLVPDAERRAAMRRDWQLVPAEAREGEDHPSEEIYLTGLWRTYTPVLGELRHTELAGPHRALTINVVGPCNLWVELGRQPAHAATPLALGPDLEPGDTPLYRLHGLREDGVFLSGTRRLGAGSGGHGVVAVHVPVPPGPATLLLEPVNFRCQARFFTDVANTLDGIEVARVVGPVGAEGRYLELQPDVAITRLFDAQRTERDEPYVVAEVVHERGRDETEVRIGARRPVPVDASDEALPLRLAVDLLDGAGEVIERRDLEAAAEASTLALAWGDGDTAQRVTALTTFRLRCPRAVRRLRVHAAEPTLVAFYTRLRRLEDVLRVPEDYPASPEVASSRIADGRIKPPTWYYFRPENAFVLASLGRETRVRQQRRLFRPRDRADAEQQLSNFTRTLTPTPLSGAGAAHAVRVVEPARDEGERSVVVRGNARWEVDAGAEERLRLRDGVRPESVRPVPLELLGVLPATSTADALLLAWIDGRLVLERALAPGGQALDLGAHTPGVHRLRLELYHRPIGAEAYRPATAQELQARLFVNHAVLGRDERPDPSRVAHERMFHELHAGAPLAFELVRTSSAAARITCAVVAPPTGGSLDDRDLLDVAIERWAPGEAAEPVSERLVSVLRSERAVTPCLDGVARGVVRRFYLSVGGDLPAGRYRVRIATRSEAPLLVRAVAVDPTPTRIGRGRFAHFDLRGPAHLRVAVSGDALAARGTEQVRLVYRIQGTDAPAPLRALTVERAAETGGDAVAVLAVPEGLHTVSVAALGEPITTRFHVDRAVHATPGVEILRLSAEVSELTWLEVLPTHRHGRWHTTGPDAPVAFDVRPATLRSPAPPLYTVRVRAVLDADAPEVLDPLELEVRCLDEAGVALASHRAALELAPDDAARVLEHPTWYPSDDALAYLTPPTGTARVELRAVSASAVVRLERTVRPDRPRYAFAPLDASRPEGVRAADDAHLPRRVDTVAPRDGATLAASGRSVTLEHAAPRVVLVDEPAPVDSAYGPVAINGVDAVVPVLEEAGEVDAADWEPWLLVQLDPGAESTVHLPERAPDGPADDVLQILFDLGGPPPPDPVEAVVDGRRAAVTLPVSRRGELRVNDLAPGAHTLSLRGLPADARVYANRPPTAHGAVIAFRRRTLARLSPGVPLSVVVEKPAGGDALLVGTVYLPDASPVAPTLEVDVRPLTRREGVLLPERTTAQRRVVLIGGEQRTLLDMSRQVVDTWSAHPFAVPLKQDLPSGSYAVELRLHDAHEAYLHAGVSHPGALVVERVRRRILRVEDAR